MSGIVYIWLDLEKNLFQVHWADCVGRAALLMKLRRAQALTVFGDLRSNSSRRYSTI
jgi:hypothetical protein